MRIPQGAGTGSLRFPDTAPSHPHREHLARMLLLIPPDGSGGDEQRPSVAAAEAAAGALAGGLFKNKGEMHYENY